MRVILALVLCATLAGCAGAPPPSEGDLLEEELAELFDSLANVTDPTVAWTPTGVRVTAMLDDRDTCASRAAAATSIAETYTETDHSVHTPHFTFTSKQREFHWVHFDPDFVSRYTAATIIWCETLDTAARDTDEQTDFVRGAEFALALTAEDDTAAATLLAEVTAAATEVGLLIRPGGVSVSVPD